MEVRLIHPEHGATHVYGPLELEAHLANGWQTEGEATLKAALAESMRLDPPVVLPVLDEPPRRQTLKVKR
jgi:hypothetical protein